MKKILNYTLILVVLLTGVIACSVDDENVTTPTEPNGKKAVLNLDKETLAFGKIELKKTKNLTFTVTNKGTGTLEVKSVTLKGAAKAEFTIMPKTKKIEAGKNAVFTVTFAPTVSGDKVAELELVTNVGTKKISITGNGSKDPVANLHVNLESLAFGEIEHGTKKELSFVVTNKGTAPLKITSVELKGKDKAMFTKTGGPQNIDAGKDVTFKVTFDSTLVGDKVAELELVTNVGTKTISLTGKGIDPLVVSNKLDFGVVFTGKKELKLVITNKGKKIIKFGQTNKITGADKADFALVSQRGFTGTTNDLSPGAELTFLMSFEPTSIGNKEAKLEIETDAGDKIITLTGKSSKNEFTIKDAEFKNYLTFYGMTPNTDGSFNRSDAVGFDRMYLESYPKIKSLEGIEEFTNLTTLTMKSNLDLTTIDLSKNINLAKLKVVHSVLEKIDLSNTNIIKIDIINSPSLKELNTKGCSRLTYINIRFSGIESIELGDSPSLKK